MIQENQELAFFNEQLNLEIEQKNDEIKSITVIIF